MMISQTDSSLLSQRRHIVRYVWLFNKDFCTVLKSLTLSIPTDRKYVLCRKIFRIKLRVEANRQI